MDGWMDGWLNRSGSSAVVANKSRGGRIYLNGRLLPGIDNRRVTSTEKLGHGRLKMYKISFDSEKTGCRRHEYGTRILSEKQRCDLTIEK